MRKVQRLNTVKIHIIFGRIFQVKPNTVVNIKQDKTMYNNNNNNQNEARKYHLISASGEIICGPMLLEGCLKSAKLLRLFFFICSTGWMTPFKTVVDVCKTDVTKHRKHKRTCVCV